MKKYHFTYRDNSAGKVILEIDEDDILLADKEVEKILGKPVVKCPYVGCEVKLNHK